MIFSQAHGSLNHTGKVKRLTPKVERLEKRKKKTGIGKVFFQIKLLLKLEPIF
jgi:hypothetical protein